MSPWEDSLPFLSGRTSWELPSPASWESPARTLEAGSLRGALSWLDGRLPLRGNVKEKGKDGFLPTQACEVG